MLSCKILNSRFQDVLNPGEPISGSRFRVGDKVINCKNNYELKIVNGDIGYVLDINRTNKTIIVKFDSLPDETVLPLFDNDLQLAYVLTAHKAQGSEFPIVVIPIHAVFGHLIMQRNRIYTAISRAQNICIIVGQKDEVPKIISRNRQHRRYTSLEEFLKSGA